MARTRRRRKTKVRKKNNKNSMQTAFMRFMLVIAFFIFWIGAVSVRLVHLQVNEYDKWKNLVTMQQQGKVTFKAMRGTVYDRNSEPLAMSVPVYSLTLNPSMITEPEKVASEIAPFLKLNAKTLAKKIRAYEKRQFMWVAREIEEESEEKIRKEFFYNENGERREISKHFAWLKEQKREYPNGTLASQVIGFSDRDDVGRAGIEQSQEQFLKAQEIKRIIKRDSRGRVFGELGDNVNEANEANDVYLTIDRGFQNIAEKALEKGVKRVNAKSGKAIVLSVKTGEVLAMANYPTFDPAQVGKLNPEAWRNHAIQEQHAPGSTFKLVTYAAALEEGLIKANDEVDCSSGKIRVGNYDFKDSHNIGIATYTKAFAESSNVGAIQVGLKLGKKDFYAYAKDFGFGNKTRIGLPAEGSGIVNPVEKWSGSTLPSMSIGYSVNVTALQSAVAFATIANDGVQIQPKIVKSVKDKNGNVVYKNEVKKKRIVSKETANQLKEMLGAVVLDGTAKKATLNGFSAGGKTGTAWRYKTKGGGFDKEKYIASFVGFAPIDDPEIVVAVVVNEPKGALRYGGDVSAPIFSLITQNVLRELGIAPDVDYFEHAPEKRIPSEVKEENKAAQKPEKKPSPKPTKSKDKKKPKAIPNESAAKKKTVRKQRERKT